MLPTGPVTRDDLDDLGLGQYPDDEALALAAELVAAVDQDRVVDKTDIGYALNLAAELTETTGDLDGAVALAERSLEAYRRYDDEPERDGFLRAYRAGLLLQAGREDEGMAELEALRPLLSKDPDAASYLIDALEADGRVEVAEEWLTVALETLVELHAERDAAGADDARDEAAMMLFVLSQSRHRLRRELELPHDDLDDLADLLADAAEDLDDDEGGLEGSEGLFWPREEYEQVMRRWPELAEAYGASWDEHRAWLEQELTAVSEAGGQQLALVVGSADELATFVAEHGGEPTDLDLHDAYADQLAGGSRELPWPPERNEACWCGSGAKYKKCCLPRSRT